MNLEEMTIEELTKLSKKLWEDIKNNGLLYNSNDKMVQEAEKIDGMIYFKNHPVIESNRKIDLRKSNNLSEEDDNLIGDYNIYLHNTDIQIGFISYRGYHCKEMDRDIGYMIYDEYIHY